MFASPQEKAVKESPITWKEHSELLQDQYYLILSRENLLHFLACQNRAWYTQSLWFIHLELRRLPLQEACFPLGCMFFLDELPRNYLLLLGASVIVPSLRITCTPTSSCHIHEKFWNLSVQNTCWEEKGKEILQIL